MKVKFKDIEKFKTLIFQSGHTLRSFSLEIGMNPATLYVLTKRNSLSPQSAKLIYSKLNLKFDDIFLISMSSNDDKKAS